MNFRQAVQSAKANHTRSLAGDDFKRNTSLEKSTSRNDFRSSQSPMASKSISKADLNSPQRTTRREMTSPAAQKRKQFKDDMQNLLTEHMHSVSEKMQNLLIHKISLEIPIQMQLYEENLKRTMEEVLRSRVEDIFRNIQDFYQIKIKFLLNKLGYDTNRIELHSPAEAERFSPNIKFSLTQFTRVDPKAQKEIQKELDGMQKSIESLKIQRFNREQDPYEFDATSLGFKAQAMKNELIDVLNHDVRNTSERLFEFSTTKIGELIKNESGTLHERLMLDLERNVQYLEDSIRNRFEDFITRKMNELFERLQDQPKKTQFSPPKRSAQEQVTPNKSLPIQKIPQESERTFNISESKKNLLADSKLSARNNARDKIQQIKNSLNFLSSDEQTGESTIELVESTLSEIFYHFRKLP
jgi:hypothetical protein